MSEAHAAHENATDPQGDFESLLAELQKIVQRLESDNIALEDSLAAFERGVLLSRACEKALSDAEKRVLILLGNGDKDPRDPRTE